MFNQIKPERGMSMAKKKEVFITVQGGVAVVEGLPKGVKVRIRDYDVQEETGFKDKHGDYVDMVWD